MSLIRWRRAPLTSRPFDFMDRVMDELDRHGLTSWGWGEGQEYGPAVDVYETDDEVVVRAQMPGVSKDEIEITVQENTLTIRAETKREEEVEEEGYFRRELRYGTLARTLPLPADIDEEQVTATLADGVLEVHAKKAEKPEAAGRKIEVE